MRKSVIVLEQRRNSIIIIDSNKEDKPAEKNKEDKTKPTNYRP